ncbi:MAG: hypothetical protein ORN83_08905 [Chthoniobacteraceae bacterium]|nr:hypothetical protein [Chthoniobacteraceae bacterium]
MTPLYFRRGEPIDASKLNALVDGVLAGRLQPGVGYTVANTSRGTSLNISLPSAGGSTAVCPFQVTTANEGDNWKFSIAWGMVGFPPVLPIGMLPNNKPPLTMTWSDGWVYMRVEFIEYDTAVKEVAFEIAEEIPPPDIQYAYYPIAYLDTDSSGENPTQRIQNLCSSPVPSVCDLALLPPA